jgi:cell division protein FtsB
VTTFSQIIEDAIDRLSKQATAVIVELRDRNVSLTAERTVLRAAVESLAEDTQAPGPIRDYCRAVLDIADRAARS